MPPLSMSNIEQYEATKRRITMNIVQFPQTCPFCKKGSSYNGVRDLLSTFEGVKVTIPAVRATFCTECSEIILEMEDVASHTQKIRKAKQMLKDGMSPSWITNSLKMDVEKKTSS
ncbi:type II toxin-antitoxin system MqsA family antitoxin [Pseudomonas luteola]